MCRSQSFLTALISINGIDSTSKWRTALPLVLALSCLAACDTQSGYVHSSHEFTELDKRAVARVQGIALGQSELLNSIAAEYTDVDGWPIQARFWLEWGSSTAIQ